MIDTYFKLLRNSLNAFDLNIESIQVLDDLIYLDKLFNYLELDLPIIISDKHISEFQRVPKYLDLERINTDGLSYIDKNDILDIEDKLLENFGELVTNIDGKNIYNLESSDIGYSPITREYSGLNILNTCSTELGSIFHQLESLNTADSDEVSVDILNVEELDSDEALNIIENNNISLENIVNLNTESEISNIGSIFDEVHKSYNYLVNKSIDKEVINIKLENLGDSVSDLDKALARTLLGIGERVLKVPNMTLNALEKAANEGKKIYRNMIVTDDEDENKDGVE